MGPVSPMATSTFSWVVPLPLRVPELTVLGVFPGCNAHEVRLVSDQVENHNPH